MACQHCDFCGLQAFTNYWHSIFTQHAHWSSRLCDLSAKVHVKRSFARLLMVVCCSGFREWKKSAWRRLLEIILTKKRRKRRRSESAAFWWMKYKNLVWIVCVLLGHMRLFVFLGVMILLLAKVALIELAQLAVASAWKGLYGTQVTNGFCLALVG